MPQDIPFTWSEDENMLYFVLQVRGAKQKCCDVDLCDVYVKVNCRPQLFAVDLRYEVEPEDKQTMCKIGGNKITLSLKKRKPGLWQDFHAVGSKAELQERRRMALAAAAERQTDRYKLKEDRKIDLIKAAEHEQWRLDRENREQIEKWEAEEKAKWEQELLSGFDENGYGGNDDTRAPADDEDCDLPDIEESVSAPKPKETEVMKPKTVFNPEKAGEVPNVCEVTDEEAENIRAQKNGFQLAGKPEPATDRDAIWSEKDLNGNDEYEEYVPDVRENPGKVGMRFSVRPRPGVPVRDNGQNREPPQPKSVVKSELPPMLAGDREQDEEDPVWLKDKADNSMVAGDYQGAYNAYTEALKLGIHPNAFANRSVADMYLGNFEQCIEDCNRAIAVIDKRNKPPPGQPSPPCDPQDAIVRTRCEVRLGTAFLWLGAFKRSEEHFQKAVDSEEGLDREERAMLKEDLARVQKARAALVLKEKADAAARRAHGSEDLVQKELTIALATYDEALNADAESAVVYANRCFAHLRAGNLEQCVSDVDTALSLLKSWPIPRRAPKAPARPARLDPPMLDDPTFVHPDEKKQNEVDWLMKHSGGDTSNLPALPPEYEWMKDTAEKNDDAWIAIRRKLSKVTMDAIRDATRALQDSLYSRNAAVIREAIKVGSDWIERGEGPSHKAMKQAEDYAIKCEAHAKEEEAKRLREEAEFRQEIEEYDLEEALDPTRTGIAKAGFVRSNTVECTQRRLFAKVLLRRARAHELLGNLEAGACDLRTVRKVEPENREAKQRLKDLEALLVAQATPIVPAPSSPSGTPIVSAGGPGDEAGGGLATPASPSAAGEVKVVAQPAAAVRAGNAAETDGQQARGAGKQTSDLMEDDDEEDEVFDHAASTSLLASAADYMRKNDYQAALQIYNYVRRRCKDWESPLVELKVLSNTSLCLQRLRGRLPELIKACSEALQRIDEIRANAPDAVPEDTLLNMECAVLSRRGNAYSQQQRPEESSRDAARVRELLGKPA